MIVVCAARSAQAAAAADACRLGGYETLIVAEGSHFSASCAAAVLWDTQIEDACDAALVRELRRAAGDAPLVALVGFPRPDDVGRASQAGVTAIVSKPYRVRDLLWHLTEAIRLDAALARHSDALGFAVVVPVGAQNLALPFGLVHRPGLHAAQVILLDGGLPRFVRLRQAASSNGTSGGRRVGRLPRRNVRRPWSKIVIAIGGPKSSIRRATSSWLALEKRALSSSKSQPQSSPAAANHARGSSSRPANWLATVSRVPGGASRGSTLSRSKTSQAQDFADLVRDGPLHALGPGIGAHQDRSGRPTDGESWQSHDPAAARLAFVPGHGQTQRSGQRERVDRRTRFPQRINGLTGHLVQRDGKLFLSQLGQHDRDSQDDRGICVLMYTILTRPFANASNQNSRRQLRDLKVAAHAERHSSPGGTSDRMQTGICHALQRGCGAD